MPLRCMQRLGSRSRAKRIADADTDFVATQNPYQAPCLLRVNLAGLDALFQVLNGLIATSLECVEHLLQGAALDALSLEVCSQTRQLLAFFVPIGLELSALLGQLSRLSLQFALALIEGLTPFQLHLVQLAFRK